MSKKRKHVDFKTVKRKLGKKYRSASHTNLSFQTRSIYIPTQSVSVEKDDYVNSRNLTLPDLLSQSRHHNEKTRKEAVKELKDFLLQYPMVMEKSMSNICEKLVELMLDSSSDVRTGLHDLLDRVLPIIPETLIAPFFPLFVAHVNTGLTHVNGAVRLDALQYLNVWLHYHPALVAKYHAKLLPHYLTIGRMRDPPPKVAQQDDKIRRLPTQQKGPTAAQLHIPNALKMKTILLTSFYDLVVAVIGHGDLFDLEDDIGTSAAKYAHKHLHLGNLDEDEARINFPAKTRLSLVVPLQPSYTLESVFLANKHLQSVGLSKIVATVEQHDDVTLHEERLDLQSPDNFKYFFTLLFPQLLAHWLECDPENLSPHALKPLEQLLKLFDLILSHFGNLIGNDPESLEAKHAFLEPYLQNLERHMFNRFPLSYNVTWSTDELKLVTHLNVLLTMVASHFYSPETSDTTWGQAIVNFALNAFSGQIDMPTGRRGKQDTGDGKTGKSSKSSSGDTLHFQMVSELLPVFKRFAESSPSAERTRLLKAFQVFNEECPAKSSSKRLCISFLSSLILSDSEDLDQCSLDTKMDVDADTTEPQTMEDDADAPLLLSPPSRTSSIPPEILQSLIMSLPKTLWQLQADHPLTTQAILGIISHFGSASALPARKAILDRLQSAFVPFFWTTVAKKAKKSSKKPAENEEGDDRKAVFGPFANLPLHVQKAAINVLEHMHPLSANMTESLLHTFSSPKVLPEAVDYLLETLQVGEGLHFGSVGDFISFALSFLIATASEHYDNDATGKLRLRRCFVISRILARACARLGLGISLLDLIDEHLASILSDSFESTSSDEYALSCAGLCFLGTYLRLIHDEIEISTSLQESITKSALLVLLRSASASKSFHPNILLLKDLFWAHPQTLTGVLSRYAEEIAQRSPSEADPTILLDLITRYRSPAVVEVLTTSTALKAIIDALHAHDAEDAIVRRVVTEHGLLATTM